jgi:hypothetical protein
LQTDGSQRYRVDLATTNKKADIQQVVPANGKVRIDAAKIDRAGQQVKWGIQTIKCISIPQINTATSLDSQVIQ